MLVGVLGVTVVVGINNFIWFLSWVDEIDVLYLTKLMDAMAGLDGLIVCQWSSLAEIVIRVGTRLSWRIR